MFEDWTPDHWNRALTGVAAFAGLAQAAVAVMMVRGLKHSANASDAATKTLQHMEVTTKVQLRAYVVMSRSEFSGFDAGKDAVVQLVLKNLGQTPAYNFRARLAPHYGPADKQIILPPPDASDGEFMTLAPGHEVIVWWREYPVDWQPHLHAMNAGLETLYIRGAFAYDDAFGDHRSGEIQMICADPAKHEAGHRLAYTSKGNRAD